MLCINQQSDSEDHQTQQPGFNLLMELLRDDQWPVTRDTWHVTRDTWRDWHVDTDYRELTLYHNITLLVMHHLPENPYGCLFGFILTYYIFLISQKQCVQIWIVCLSKSLMWSFYKSVPDPNMYWLPSTFLILASNTINYTLSTYFWLHWDM